MNSLLKLSFIVCFQIELVYDPTLIESRAIEKLAKLFLQIKFRVKFIFIRVPTSLDWGQISLKSAINIQYF